MPKAKDARREGHLLRDHGSLGPRILKILLESLPQATLQQEGVVERAPCSERQALAKASPTLTSLLRQLKSGHSKLANVLHEEQCTAANCHHDTPYPNRCLLSRVCLHAMFCICRDACGQSKTVLFCRSLKNDIIPNFKLAFKVASGRVSNYSLTLRSSCDYLLDRGDIDH